MFVLANQDVLWLHVSVHNFEVEARLQALHDRRRIKDGDVVLELTFFFNQVAQRPVFAVVKYEVEVLPVRKRLLKVNDERLANKQLEQFFLAQHCLSLLLADQVVFVQLLDRDKAVILLFARQVHLTERALADTFEKLKVVYFNNRLRR